MTRYAARSFADPPSALPQAALGALRKTDIFLEHDLLITLHPGHAVMSYSTVKPCKGVKPLQKAWSLGEIWTILGAFGIEARLEGRACVSDLSWKRTQHLP